MPSNLPLLEEAAAKLKHLLLEVVFAGGSTLDLMVTDQGLGPDSINILCRRDRGSGLRRLLDVL
jgi:hypothetical protein